MVHFGTVRIQNPVFCGYLRVNGQIDEPSKMHFHCAPTQTYEKSQTLNCSVTKWSLLDPDPDPSNSPKFVVLNPNPIEKCEAARVARVVREALLRWYDVTEASVDVRQLGKRC